jgi:hypothetical protein
MDGQVKVIAQVIQERRMQDRQWGGADHDDTHTHIEWLNYIHYQQNRALNKDKRRDAMIKIAALAVAALESIDRKA